MPIEDWAPTMTAKLGTITGLNPGGGQAHRVRDYRDLPGAIREFPTLIWLPQRAQHNYSAGGPGIWVHELVATLYLSQQILPEAHQVAIPYIKRVRDLMAANFQLGGLSWPTGRVAHWAPAPDAPFYEGPGITNYGMAAGEPFELCGIVFRWELKETETGVSVTP